jgi:hypothetical protein
MMFRLLKNRVFEAVVLITFVAAVAAGGYRDGFKDGPWLPPSPWDNVTLSRK